MELNIIAAQTSTPAATEPTTTTGANAVANAAVLRAISTTPPPASAPVAAVVPAAIDAEHRRQQTGFGGVRLDLLPEPTNVHGDRRFVSELPPPHVGEQLSSGQRLPGIAQEVHQQVEFAAGQPKVGTRPAGLVGCHVDTQVSVGEGFPLNRRRALGAPQNGLHPQHDLAGTERFGDVVVGAHLQAEQSVWFVAARGEHQDRQVPTLGAQPAEHLGTLDSGQHQIEHDEIGVGGRQLQRLLTVGGQVDAHPGPVEVGRQHLSHGGIVVDDEHAGHRTTVSARQRAGPSPAGDGVMTDRRSPPVDGPVQAAASRLSEGGRIRPDPLPQPRTCRNRLSRNRHPAAIGTRAIGTRTPDRARRGVDPTR
jgi:hypothetical protein